MDIFVPLLFIGVFFNLTRALCAGEIRGYSHLKEEALHRTIWRQRFGGGFGPVVRQNIE